MKLLELEMKLSNSLLTYDEFTFSLWSMCISKLPEHKKQVRQFAKELNIYPKGANVYTAIINHFFNNIAL